MAGRTDLDYVLTKLKKEHMYDMFLTFMRLVAEGETFTKKVAKAGTGGSGCIFVPKRLIGQHVRVVIMPIHGEIVAANQAVIHAENRVLVANRKLRRMQEKQTEAAEEADKGEFDDDIKELEKDGLIEKKEITTDKTLEDEDGY